MNDSRSLLNELGRSVMPRRRYELTDEQYKRIEGLLSPEGRWATTSVQGPSESHQWDLLDSPLLWAFVKEYLQH